MINDSAEAGSRPIAYLTSEYPKFSHTFIQREVAALRELGETVATCATRRPPEAALTGPEERAEHARTFAIMERAKRPAALLGAVMAALLRPLSLLKSAHLALRARSAGARGWLYALFYLVEAMILAHHLRRLGARRLHVHFANAACTVGMLAARMAGIPFSFTLHGPSDFLDPEQSRLDVKLAEAEFVACISNYARGRVMAHLSEAQGKKLHIVHCGVDPARYGSAAAPTGRGILFVGRLAEVKGVPLLIDAASRISAEFPDATLTIVGDGELRSALEAKAAKSDMKAIRFTGAIGQDDVAAELAKAAIFALPSDAEGVPVVLMEAMAAGRPVVATRITGVPELVTDGVSGLLIEPGDVDGLTAALRELLAAPENWPGMGAAGRQKVLEEFDIDIEARRLAALFRSYDAGAPPEQLRPQPVA